MAGLPGIAQNNPEGFVDLTDPNNVSTFVVEHLATTASIPISVLPFFRNDGGFRSYGGARVISIFENGVQEGTSTAHVTAVTQQPIVSTGVFQITPDAQKIYAIRIRLRSVENDPNYKDYVLNFRVATPLQTPIQFQMYLDSDIPNILFDGVDFTFDDVPPSAEIILRYDGDGIRLPTTTAPWPSNAFNYMVNVLERNRDGIFTIDFLRSGAVECTCRQVYAYRFIGPSYTFVKLRRQDFPEFNAYSGSDLGFVQATIRQPNVAGSTPVVAAPIFPEVDLGEPSLFPGTPNFISTVYDSFNDDLYAIALDGVNGPRVYTINLGTLFLTPVSTNELTGNDPRCFMYIAGSANAYYQDDNNEFYELDLTDATDSSASAPWMMRFHTGTQWTSLAGNTFVAVEENSSNLYIIDPTTADSQSFIGQINPGLTAIAIAQEGVNTNTFLVLLHDSTGPENIVARVTIESGIGGYSLTTALLGQTTFDNNQISSWSYIPSRNALLFREWGSTPSFTDLMQLVIGQRGEAFLTITANPYGIGPGIETCIVAGKKGFIDISPAMILSGGVVDVSDVVEFDSLPFNSRFGVADQYLCLVAVTDKQVIVRQIPLWPQATSLYSVGGQVGIDDIHAPPTYVLNARLLFWPFLSFPNITDFYDPAPAAPQPYPNIGEVSLIDEAGVTQETWTDGADLYGDLVNVRVPDAGLAFPVLDLRSYVSSTDSFIKLRVEILVDGTGLNDYIVEETFPINANGVPIVWERPDMNTVQEMPQFTFNNWGRLTVTYPNPWTAEDEEISIEGDIGTVVVSGTAGSTDTYDLTDGVMSRLSGYIRATWVDTNDVTVSVLVSTTSSPLQLQGSDAIAAFFDGNTIVFTDLSVVTGDRITIVGDIGAVSINSPVENNVYRIGTMGSGSNIIGNPGIAYIDVYYTSTNGPQHIRFPNTMFRFRDGGQSNDAIAVKNRGGHTSTTKSVAYRFQLPKAMFDADSTSIVFENDSSFAGYNLSMFTFINGRTGQRKTFHGALQTGVMYNIGEVSRGLGVGDFITVSARHVSGTGEVVMYRLDTEYQPAVNLMPEGLF